MKGYIVKSKEGLFLSHELVWFPHDHYTEAWVHDESILRIIRRSPPWDILPEILIPAEYTETNGVILTGLEDGLSEKLSSTLTEVTI